MDDGPLPLAEPFIQLLQPHSRKPPMMAGVNNRFAFQQLAYWFGISTRNRVSHQEHLRQFSGSWRIRLGLADKWGGSPNCKKKLKLAKRAMQSLS